MADGTYQPKVYRKQGGDEFVIAAGGTLTLEAGASFVSAEPAVSSYSAKTAGASVDGSVFTTSTEVELGTYANAANAKLDFGAAGSVTGLGGAFCAELDLGPGTDSGTYTVFEGELIAPSGAATGTLTSFMRLGLSGAGAAAVDTAGYLLDIQGLTPNTGKLLRVGLSQAVTAVGSIRIKVGATDYYLPICASPALTS